MIEKNYPDKMAGELRKVSNVFLVVTGAILAAIILFVFLVFFQNINSLKNFSREDFKVNLLGLISMIAFPSVGIYIFCMQIALGKAIRRNFEKTMDNFLKN